MLPLGLQLSVLLPFFAGLLELCTYYGLVIVIFFAICSNKPLFSRSLTLIHTLPVSQCTTIMDILQVNSLLSPKKPRIVMSQLYRLRNVAQAKFLE